MLGSSGVEAWLAAAPAHPSSFVLWDYVPAAVVAVVLLAAAVALVLVASHHRRDVE